MCGVRAALFLNIIRYTTSLQDHDKSAPARAVCARASTSAGRPSPSTIPVRCIRIIHTDRFNYPLYPDHRHSRSTAVRYTATSGRTLSFITFDFFSRFYGLPSTAAAADAVTITDRYCKHCLQ